MEFWISLIILKDIKKHRLISARLGDNPFETWYFLDNIQI